MSRPSSVARFNSVSLIASGVVNLFFKSVIAACKSAAPKESISCSFGGVPEGEGDGVADFAGAGVLLGDGVGEDDGRGDGAGDCAKACAASEIEMTIAMCQTNRNITLIVIR